MLFLTPNQQCQSTEGNQVKARPIITDKTCKHVLLALKPRSSSDPRTINSRRWIAQNATIRFFSSEFSDQTTTNFCTTSTQYNVQEQQQPFYGHYTGQPALAGNSS